jgi:pyrroline-5-carboxylate reductase
MRTAIVGVGNLGFAVAQRLLAAGVPSSALTLVTRGSDGSNARCRELGLQPQDVSQIAGSNTVIMAVKPQDSGEVSRALGPFLDQDAVVLSLMAGVSVVALEQSTGHKSIARAMPNLGAMVGESATTYYISSSMIAEHIERVEFVVSSLGRSWRVESEELIDLATAVAGSGPAYLCWLGEHIERVARDHGLSDADTHAIVLQTFKGTVAYLEASSETFHRLRTRVTSPQGTTAAAVSLLEQNEADKSIREAVTAAFVRAKELGALVS